MSNIAKIWPIIGLLALVNCNQNCAEKAGQLESVGLVAKCGDSLSVGRKCEATPKLKELFRLVGLKTEDNFQSMVTGAQETWKRPVGVERWQLKEKFADKRDLLVPLFRELGFIDAVHAKEKFYEYACVHGASIQGVKSRLDWLVSEFKRGVRFNKIIVLSGVRKLDEEHEMPLILKDIHDGEKVPTNETEMIAWLIPHIDMPIELREIPIVMVNALASDTRAHTGDTVIKWMNDNPTKGSILAFSSQPYVSYQDMSMRNRLAPGFTLETIGDKAGDVMNAVYLDNVARLLFELQKWTAS